MRLWATDGHRSEAESPSVAKNGTIVQTRSLDRTVLGIIVVVGLSQFFGCLRRQRVLESDSLERACSD